MKNSNNKEINLSLESVDLIDSPLIIKASCWQIIIYDFFFDCCLCCCLCDDTN
jgi:hypothetical protein